MPTVVSDRMGTIDFIDYTNNHVFSKCQTDSLNIIKNGSLKHDDYLRGLANGKLVAKQLIGDALRQRVESIDYEFCEPGDEDTFFVADLGEVYRQHLRWKLNLPRVKPFYGEYFHLLGLRIEESTC